MSINLRFLLNEGDEDEGLGNAGIETYREDPYAGAARETGQNSKDAGTALPVRITFDVLDVPFSEIPDLENLRGAVESCLSKARAAHNDKEIAFFEQARNVLANGPLKIFRIADSNTLGLRGPNTSGTPFHSLVKGSGVSVKQSNTSGGSFGIGKNAVYTISDLQTVFYSTMYEDQGRNIFLAQGKSILVSHNGQDGQPRRAVGYWGLHNLQPITNPADAPAWLRRDTQGTSVFAIGFRETEDWEHRIAYALLQNFFHAIHGGEMEFSIDNNRIVINKANINAMFEDAEILAVAKRNDREQAFEFSRDLFRCLIAPEAKEHEIPIQGLGRVLIRVLAADGLPKRVCIIRNGMVITDNLSYFGDKLAKFNMHRDFVALVVPLDNEGRALIKTLEDPKHENLSAERLPDEPRRAHAKSVMKKLVKAIRDTIKAHTLAKFDDEVTADELKKYFAAEQKSTAQAALEGQNNVQTIQYRIEPKRDRSPPRAATRGTGTAGGQRTGGTHGEGPGPGPGKNPRPRAHGSGGSGESKHITLSDIRNFVPADNNPKARTIFFTPSAGGKAIISLEAPGLAVNEALRVVRANGTAMSAGRIELPVTANQRARINVEFDEPYVGPIELQASLEPDGEVPNEAK